MKVSVDLLAAARGAVNGPPLRIHVLPGQAQPTAVHRERAGSLLRSFLPCGHRPFLAPRSEALMLNSASPFLLYRHFLLPYSASDLFPSYLQHPLLREPDTDSPLNSEHYALDLVFLPSPPCFSFPEKKKEGGMCLKSVHNQTEN